MSSGPVCHESVMMDMKQAYYTFSVELSVGSYPHVTVRRLMA